MSKITVSNAIREALSNDPMSCTGARIDANEARDIVFAAERSIRTGRNTPVTNGEVKLIGDLFSRDFNPRPGDMYTLACPENPGQFTMDPAARETFQAFFGKHGAPYGDNAVTIKDSIQSTISSEGYGPQLDKAPKTKNLHHVFIRDSRPVDGDRVDAFVDSRRGEFYIKSTGAGMAGPDTVGPYWYGPLKLAKIDDTIPSKDVLLNAFQSADRVEWSTDGMPVGGKYTSVPLYKQPGFDTYQYTAMVQNSDPNVFFVQRSGGFAGMTMFAGPFYVDQTTPTPAPTPVQLPEGIWQMDVNVVQGFGAMGTSVRVFGELNSIAWTANVSDAAVDAKAQTITITVGAELQTSGPVIMITAPFDQTVELPTLDTGDWTFNVVDADGNLLQTQTHTIFPRF